MLDLPARYHGRSPVETSFEKLRRLMRSLSVIGLTRIIMRRFDEDRCMQIASSLTFTSLLAIVPIVTVAVTVISAFPVFAQLMAALQVFILENLMPASAEAVASYTEQFSNNATKLTAVGIAFLVVTAIMLLLTIDRAFNDIWRVEKPRPVVQRLLVYSAVIIAGPVLMGASLMLTSWLVGEAIGLVRGLPGAGVVLLTLVPFVFTSLALALLYAAMPNRPVSLLDAAMGGFLAAFAFEMMKRAFALYISYFSTYTIVYGAFATFPLFLIWIYLSWLVVISGAVVVASLPEWREARLQRERTAGEATAVKTDETEATERMAEREPAGEATPAALAAHSTETRRYRN
jgi:membrane protein